MCLWTAPADQRDAYLKACWVDGQSAGQIATAMHTNRNRVSGRLFRLGLFRSNINAQRRRPKVRIAKPAPKSTLTRKRLSPEVIVTALTDLTEPPKPEVLPNTSGEAILWLEKKSCRYPYGDPHTNNFYFCSETQIEGSSYCLFHSKLCINRPNPESAHGRQRPHYRS